MMRRALFTTLVALLFATGCGDLLDPAAAVVHGRKITVAEVESVLAEFTTSEAYNERAQQGEGDVVEREFERNYLSQLIRRAVLEPAADELGISVTDEEVDERLARIKADFPNEAAFRETVREQGLTQELLRQIIRDRAIEDAIRAEVTRGVAPSQQDLIDYYDENLDEFRETRAQHILVEDKSLAEDLSARLDLALEDRVDDLFSKLAAEHSIDQASATRGGDLGWAPAGTYVDAFEAALIRLETGEVSRPVRTDFGWHLIRVVDRRTRPFAAVKDSIEERLAGPLRDEAWNEWLERAYAEAEVIVNPRYGTFDVATQQIVDPEAEDVPGAEAPSDGAATPPGPDDPGQ